jgi:predicted transcriptional regulator
MQLKLVRELVGMFVERIVSKTFPKETGAARLQQLGLFTLIFVLEENSSPVTTARLSELTGQSRSRVHKQLEKLVKVGVVKRTQHLNKQGRGYVFHLSIKYTPRTKRLIKAMEKASGQRKR